MKSICIRTRFDGNEKSPHYILPCTLLLSQAHSLDAMKGTPGEEATCTEEVVESKEVREQEQQGREEQQVTTKQEPAQPTPLDTKTEERLSPTSSAIFSRAVKQLCSLNG